MTLRVLLHYRKLIIQFISRLLLLLLTLTFSHVAVRALKCITSLLCDTLLLGYLEMHLTYKNLDLAIPKIFLQ